MSSRDNRIPNLWRINEDATRLYSLYLAHLSTHNLVERVVFASRKIRRFAASGPGSKDGLFTFSHEIDALYDLKKYQVAWRQIQLRDSIACGQRFNFTDRVWTGKDSFLLETDYAPIQYFLKRYSFGCSLLESGLNFWFKHRGFDSYDILNRVYNGDQVPWHRCRVTLANFYDRLGKRLSDWQHWSEFASSFHPKLYRLGGVSRRKLLTDSDSLPQFFGNLARQQVRRIFTQDGKIRSYLTASSPTFLKYRTEQNRLHDVEKEQNRAARELRNEKLRTLFPELNGLLK